MRKENSENRPDLKPARTCCVASVRRHLAVILLPHNILYEVAGETRIQRGRMHTRITLPLSRRPSLAPELFERLGEFLSIYLLWPIR